MCKISISLNIEGDYIDSFIYSGVLYLFDFDFNIKSYKWKEICDRLYYRENYKGDLMHEKFNYIKENNNNISSASEPITIGISKEEMAALEKDTYSIGFYPSDLYIYSSKLYFSHENGVFYIETDYKSAGFADKKPTKIFDTRCFSIFPNSNGRIALASGHDGVFTYNGSNQGKKINHISSEDCIDIDWLNDYLSINNTNRKTSLKKYNKIPKNITSFKETPDVFLKSLNKDDYDNIFEDQFDLEKVGDKEFKKIKSLLLTNEPSTQRLEREYCYSWTSGDYNFLIGDDDSIDVYCDNQKIKSKNIGLSKFDKIRTSGCGTIFEKDNNLMLLDENSFTEVDNDVARWRIFPRAKSHLNHLHTIKEDVINIKVYEKGAEDVFRSFLRNEDQ